MFDGIETSNFPTEPTDPIAPEALVDELAAILVRRDRDEARATQILARVNQTRAFERDGYSSPTALLKHRMSLHPGEAQRLVRRANALPAMPLTTLVYEQGAISGAQVDVLIEVHAIAPEQFKESEWNLVELALGTSPVPELRKKLDYWLDQAARDDLASDRNHIREMRSLTLRRDGEMMRINGWLDIESGERLAAGLDPGPPAEGDTRSTPARRADLLLEMLEGSSERPGISILVSAQTLLDGRPGVSETGAGTFLTADEVRRISCDGNLTRVVLGPESQPLDVGRTKRLVTAAMRIAVIARDLHCVFPGCDRPASWCDVHHLIHWAEKGPTRSTTWSSSVATITPWSTRQDGRSPALPLSSASSDPTAPSSAKRHRRGHGRVPESFMSDHPDGAVSTSGRRWSRSAESMSPAAHSHAASVTCRAQW